MQNYSPFVLFCLLLPGFTVAADDSAERLEQLQTEIQSLSSNVEKNKTTKSELYKQLEKQSLAISKLNRQLRQTNQQLEQQSSQLDKLKQDQKQYRQAHIQQMDALNEQLRSAYLNGQANYLKLLLSQQDPAKISRSSHYFEYFHQARQQQLATINASLAVLSSQQQELSDAQQKLQLTYEQQLKEQTALKEQNKQRQQTVKQLEQTIQQQGKRIASLQEEEANLQALLRSLAKKRTTPNKKAKVPDMKFAQQRGSLNWPIQGKIVARYGSSRNVGKLTWQGIMIQAGAGRNVTATAPGRVVFSGWLRGFGLLLIVDHGDKFMTLYGNNQALLKEVGDVVKADDIIALSGDKGIKQHTGLYFEIRHKGSPVNPVKWLKRQS